MAAEGSVLSQLVGSKYERLLSVIYRRLFEVKAGRKF